MTTPDLNEARRLADLMNSMDYKDTIAGAAMLRALSDELERLRAQVATHAAVDNAADAVIARWDSPLWRDEAPTAGLIYRLRLALVNARNLAASPTQAAGLTLVDGGALQLALNVPRRAGKQEVADALESTAVRAACAARAAPGHTSIATEELVERLGEAHDASLDDDHRGARQILSALIHDLNRTTLAASPTPAAAQEEPKPHDPPIEYRYKDGTLWCPLGPAERMKPDFDGVYRIAAGKYPVEAAQQPQAAQPAIEGWVTWWPTMGGGHKPVYSPGETKPNYGPEPGARLKIYPVYAAPVAAPALTEEQIDAAVTEFDEWASGGNQQTRECIAAVLRAALRSTQGGSDGN